MNWEELDETALDCHYYISLKLDNNVLNRILLVFLEDEHTRPNLENWIYFWKIENYSGSRLSYQDLNYKLWWISVSSRMKNQLYSECRMVYILII